jgi:hypothetical protein
VRFSGFCGVENFMISDVISLPLRPQQMSLTPRIPSSEAWPANYAIALATDRLASETRKAVGVDPLRIIQDMPPPAIVIAVISAGIAILALIVSYLNYRSGNPVAIVRAYARTEDGVPLVYVEVGNAGRGETSFEILGFQIWEPYKRITGPAVEHSAFAEPLFSCRLAGHSFRLWKTGAGELVESVRRLEARHPVVVYRLGAKIRWCHMVSLDSTFKNWDPTLQIAVGAMMRGPLG